jgi:hypothetical protein
MKTPFMVFALFALLFLSSVEHVYACVCVDDKNTSLNQKVRDAYRNSAAVFAGKVVGIDKSRPQVNYITIQIIDVWKGMLRPPTITIVTGKTPQDCEFPFLPETDYLIYAVPDGNYLGTNFCLRTALIANTPDIPILDKITRRTP